MATTYSTNKGYALMGTGDESGNWGVVLNQDTINVIDANMGGTVTKSLSSSNVTLTAEEAENLQLILTGTLTADVVVTSPVIGFFTVRNYTTGQYKVTLQYTGGVGATVIPPQGCSRQIISDSTNGMFAIGLDPPGTLKETAAGTTSLPPSMTGEYVLCDGSAISRTTYAQLFNAIGTTFGVGDGTTTFNVPDERGYARFGRDNMGGAAAGRITNAVSGIDGSTLGATGGAQSVTIARSDLPNDNVNVTITDPGHVHEYQRRNTNGLAAAGSPPVSINTGAVDTDTDPAFTGITAAFDLNGGVSQTNVNKMPGTIICNKMIKT